MIEVAESSNNSRPSVGARCPVCAETVSFPLVLGNGKRADFFSPSNFQRHIVSHIQQNKAEDVIRSSKSTVKNRTKCNSTGPKKNERKRRLKNNSTRPVKRRRKNDSTSESESSDVENVQLAKDLANNYNNESDDLADDDEDMTQDDDQPVKEDIEEAGPSSRTRKTQFRKNLC